MAPKKKKGKKGFVPFSKADQKKGASKGGKKSKPFTKKKKPKK